MKLICLIILLTSAVSYSRVALPRYPTDVLKAADSLAFSEDKVVGGTEVEPNSLPFQVSVQRKTIINFVHTCGGTILTESSILTSASCVEGVTDLSILRVVAGEHSIQEDSGLEQIRNVSDYLLHPDYDYATFENDIALIYLDSALDMSKPSVEPITIPMDSSDPPSGLVATTSGWGYTSVSGSMSDVLNSVNVTIISDEECNTAYATSFNPNPVHPSMMCAGSPDGGVDACTGDAGGPLFTNENGKFIQHGIVSWGRGCALAQYPGVYTQVSYFLEWIAGYKK